jgi:hypothetical protein
MYAMPAAPHGANAVTLQAPNVVLNKQKTALLATAPEQKHAMLQDYGAAAKRKIQTAGPNQYQIPLQAQQAVLPIAIAKPANNVSIAIVLL